jgi:2-deoxy-D-gluconate 3-dehydrogenase
VALQNCGAPVIGWERSVREHPEWEVVHGDFNDTTAVQAQGEKLAAERQIDILINNAGTISRIPAEDIPLPDWQRVLRINLDAAFVLSQALGRKMLERGFGRIVSTASLLSFQGGINVASYTASKHAVAGFTKTLANEWSSRGVTVNAVAPGYIETNNTAALRQDPERLASLSDRIPIGRWGKPEDIAEPVAFLCTDAARYITGHTLVVDGGWMAR